MHWQLPQVPLTLKAITRNKSSYLEMIEALETQPINDHNIQNLAILLRLLKTLKSSLRDVYQWEAFAIEVHRISADVRRTRSLSSQQTNTFEEAQV